MTFSHSSSPRKKVRLSLIEADSDVRSDLGYDDGPEEASGSTIPLTEGPFRGEITRVSTQYNGVPG